MTKIDLQYDLINYTPASASPVEANFDRVEQHINQELIERDGTVAMRAQLKLVGDPVQALDATPKQYVDSIFPIAIIMMYGGAGAPPGGRWAMCNGAELQTSDYPELFAVLGNAYGGTSGRFNLPNLTDRFPRGAAPGATGGTADAVIVDHDHAIDHDHGAHSHTGVDHLHGDDHQHTGSTAGANARHTHGAGNGAADIIMGIAGHLNLVSGTGGSQPAWGFTNTGTDTPDHAHAFTTNYKSQQGFGTHTGAADRSLNVGATGVSFAGRSAGTPNASSHVNANLPPYVGVTYIIRVK